MLRLYSSNRKKRLESENKGANATILKPPSIPFIHPSMLPSMLPPCFLPSFRPSFRPSVCRSVDPPRPGSKHTRFLTWKYLFSSPHDPHGNDRRSQLRKHLDNPRTSNQTHLRKYIEAHMNYMNAFMRVGIRENVGKYFVVYNT